MSHPHRRPQANMGHPQQQHQAQYAYAQQYVTYDDQGQKLATVNYFPPAYFPPPGSQGLPLHAQLGHPHPMSQYQMSVQHMQMMMLAQLEADQRQPPPPPGHHHSLPPARGRGRGRAGCSAPPNAGRGHARNIPAQPPPPPPPPARAASRPAAPRVGARGGRRGQVHKAGAAGRSTARTAPQQAPAPAAAVAAPLPGTRAGFGSSSTSAAAASAATPMPPARHASSSAMRSAGMPQASMMQRMPQAQLPQVQPPAGHEWVMCRGKDGQPGWFAVPRAQAQFMRAGAASAQNLKPKAGPNRKRKAGAAAEGQPGAKEGPAGGRGKARGRAAWAADDPRHDLVTDEQGADVGAGSLLVMDDQAVMREEAAFRKGKVVTVQEGMVQEEVVLNRSSIMKMVALKAKAAGVSVVDDAVFTFLDRAVETFLGDTMKTMAKMRLQKDDTGRSYCHVVEGDDSLKTELQQACIQRKAKADQRQAQEATQAVERNEEELQRLTKTLKRGAKLTKRERETTQEAQAVLRRKVAMAELSKNLETCGIKVPTFRKPDKNGATTPLSKRATGMTRAELSAAKAAATSSSPISSRTGSRLALLPSSGIDAATPALGALPSLAVASGAAAAAAAGIPGSTSLAAAVSAHPPPAGNPNPTGSLLQQLVDAGPALNAQPDDGTPSLPGTTTEGSVLRELGLTDLVAAMERNPAYNHNHMLYKLHADAPLQGAK